MADSSSDFLAELRRRKVLRAALVYLVVALAVVEGGDVVFGTLMLPPWVMRTVVGLALVGFPITLVLAWWFDLTPDGIRRAEPWGAGLAMGAAMLVGVLAVSTLFAWLAWGRWLGGDGDIDVAASAAAEAGRDLGLSLTRVAVLYFDDHSPDGDLAYLTAGLTEELIHQLSQVRALDVVSRNGVKIFRDAPASLDSMVRVLGAGTFVEGSVQRSGDLLRVTVQLIDGASGVHLLSRTLERPWGELFALQDALAEAVTVALRERLGEAVQLEASRRSTRSIEAWEAFRRAEGAEERLRSLRMEDTLAIDRALARADGLMTRAHELDPDWVEPVVHRGWLQAGTAVALDGEYVYRSRETLEARTEAALEQAARALEMAPDDAGALELRGFLHLVRWHHGITPTPEARRQAEADLLAAVEREPSRARAWRLLSNLALKTGDFENGQRYAERALEEDAFLEDAEDIYGLLYETALNLEQLDEASRWCDEGHRRFPDSTLLGVCGLYTLASVPLDPAQIPAAWEKHREYVELTGTEPGWNRAVGLSLVAAALARAELSDSARAVMDRARAELPTDEPIAPYFAYYDAYVATLLGDDDRALDLLRRFLSEYPSQREFLPRDWWFRPLWDSARFQALMAAS
jgi:TolB-like protein